MKKLHQYFFLLCSLILIALGIVLLVKASLGINPWDAFHLGIVRISPFTHGQVLQLTGLAMILFSWAMGVKPGVGSIANMYVVGLLVDFFYWINLVPDLSQSLMLLRLLAFAAGVFCMGFGTATNIYSCLGVGPRDSVVLALSKKVPWKLGYIRMAMEVLAAASGYVLGGPLGFGTVAFALTVGPAMEIGLKFYRWLDRKRQPAAENQAVPVENGSRLEENPAASLNSNNR